MGQKLSIIAIGDELLVGQVTDTNSPFIASTVEPEGWSIESVRVVHDNAEDIRRAIEQAFERTDIVITTGGLGPTKDDITKPVLMEIFGGEPVKNESVLEAVRGIMERRGLQLNESTAAQAIVPSSARIFINEVGTAPIMWFEKNGKTLVSLPGVPFEMQRMFARHIFPAILERYSTHEVIIHRTVLTTDISESDLSERLSDFESGLPEGFHLAYLPNNGYLRLRLDGRGTDEEKISQIADDLHSELKKNCGKHLLYDRDLTPAEILLEMLKEKHLTFATAESCTGGNISHLVTMIPGSSEAMLGGIVSYSNSVKENVLGVNPADIATLGAVSEPVAAQMAEGARRATGADIAVSTSGIAGPGGAVKGKPVGTVCLAVADATGTQTWTMHFPGDRQRVISRASNTALILAIRRLHAGSGKV